jgi:hypothetical protein
VVHIKHYPPEESFSEMDEMKKMKWLRLQHSSDGQSNAVADNASSRSGSSTSEGAWCRLLRNGCRWLGGLWSRRRRSDRGCRCGWHGHLDPAGAWDAGSGSGLNGRRWDGSRGDRNIAPVGLRCLDDGCGGGGAWGAGSADYNVGPAGLGLRNGSLRDRGRRWGRNAGRD